VAPSAAYEWVGSGLPTYLTFYPAIMVVALLAGIGPGLLATALADAAVDYWILPPIGQFTIASPIDRPGTGDLYRHGRVEPGR